MSDVIHVRCGRTDRAEPFPGSTIRPCGVCGVMVFVSQNTLRQMAGRSHRFECAPCNDAGMRAAIASDEEIHELPADAEAVRQRAEVGWGMRPLSEIIKEL